MAIVLNKVFQLFEQEKKNKIKKIKLKKKKYMTLYFKNKLPFTWQFSLLRVSEVVVCSFGRGEVSSIGDLMEVEKKSVGHCFPLPQIHLHFNLFVNQIFVTFSSFECWILDILMFIFS